MFSAQVPVPVAEWENHRREWLNLGSTMSCPEHQQWAGTERGQRKQGLKQMSSWQRSGIAENEGEKREKIDKSLSL